MLENKFKSIEQVRAVLPPYNKGVIMTTGVFDILHEGHFAYLSKAREFGDLLIVGLHSDALVKQRKGENRPYFNQIQRVSALSYLGFVDHILIMEDQNQIYDQIASIAPRGVLVVSETTEDEANCPNEMCRRFDTMIKVIVLPPQSPLHTTQIINAMS